MKPSGYKNYDELPLILSVPEVAAVLGKTQAEVQEKLKKALADSQGIDVTLSDKYTLEEWISIWYTHYIKPTIRETTQNLYESFIKNHIVPYIGEIKLNKLTSLDCRNSTTN